jgi:hypothetical protein
MAGFEEAFSIGPGAPDGYVTNHPDRILAPAKSLHIVTEPPNEMAHPEDRHRERFEP